MEKEISLERYESSQKSMQELANKLELAMQMIGTLEAEKRQWVQEKIKQTEIIAHQIGNSDNVVIQLQDEIRNIKRQLCQECYKKVR